MSKNKKIEEKQKEKVVTFELESDVVDDAKKKLYRWKISRVKYIDGKLDNSKDPEFVEGTVPMTANTRAGYQNAHLAARLAGDKMEKSK